MVGWWKDKGLTRESSTSVIGPSPVKCTHRLRQSGWARNLLEVVFPSKRHAAVAVDLGKIPER